ncbi:4Fe-4S binding protein [Methanomethylovorans hollandica]
MRSICPKVKQLLKTRHVIYCGKCVKVCPVHAVLKDK